MQYAYAVSLPVRLTSENRIEIDYGSWIEHAVQFVVEINIHGR